MNNQIISAILECLRSKVDVDAFDALSNLGDTVGDDLSPIFDRVFTVQRVNGGIVDLYCISNEDYEMLRAGYGL